MSRRDDAALWRENARQCRDLAQQLSRSDARTQMLEFAIMYETMAARAEATEPTNLPKKAGS
jgi:hypothetical protein